jgi:hypothetical protein
MVALTVKYIFYKIYSSNGEDFRCRNIPRMVRINYSANLELWKLHKSVVKICKNSTASYVNNFRVSSEITNQCLNLPILKNVLEEWCKSLNMNSQKV